MRGRPRRRRKLAISAPDPSSSRSLLRKGRGKPAVRPRRRARSSSLARRSRRVQPLPQHLGPLDLAASRVGSTIVVDRDGRLLRAFTLPDGRWRLPVTGDRGGSALSGDAIGYEDADSSTMTASTSARWLRAAWQWATRGHVVSGGSTLTMQVARLIEPRDERNLATKFRQSPAKGGDRDRQRRSLGQAGTVVRDARGLTRGHHPRLQALAP